MCTTGESHFKAGCQILLVAARKGTSLCGGGLEYLHRISESHCANLSLRDINKSVDLRDSRDSRIMQPLDSFTAFYGTRRFITEFTRALHLHLS
jgi:hypothetical protein